MTASRPHRPLIVGTAGHIDHGKTALIRLLTGIDTDRLKEEKERGISIELGFASLTLPSGERLGVVDVPGHERFIKNMLAGAGGIDLILFVIAADEGVMPQTREHMDIIDLLGVRHGVIALTKIDMVEADFADIVEETVREYLADSCLRDAPIVRVSSVTGEGKEALLAALEDVAARVAVGQRGNMTRLPVDRTFTMEGFGTVVTGTLWSGSLKEGDPVRVMPAGHATRIRSLEVHGERVQQALAGQRVAVGLHGVEKASIQRGDWVLAGDGPPPTRLVDARLRALRSAEKPLENSARVRFHLGSAEVLGRLILLDHEELKPGQEGWAQIRLEEEVLTERGDHFVLRSYSPMHTIAGGVVVTAGVGKRRRHRDEDLAALRQAEKGTPEERVLAVLQRRGGQGGEVAVLSKESGCTALEVEQALEALCAAGQAVRVSKRLVAARAGHAEAGARLQGIVEGYQRGNPLSWGISKSELKKRIETAIHPELVDHWLQQALEGGTIFVRNDRLRSGTDQLDLSPEHELLRGAVIDAIEAAGFEGRKQNELLEDIQARLLGGRLTGEAASRLKALPAAKLAADTEALLRLLTDSGDLTRVPPHFFFSSRLLAEAVQRVRGFFAGQTEMKVGDLKDFLGVSRKQAVPLLEYLDQARITQRQGDVRVAGPKLQAADSPPRAGTGSGDEGAAS